jgi:hypothetical protein
MIADAVNSPFSTNTRQTIVGAILSVLFISAASGSADVLSPVGRWRTIDDTTNTPRSIVEITLHPNGEIEGKIVRTFPRAGDKPHPVCEKCQGERRDQPIIGMVILWGLKPDGTEWSGGSVLDPDSGSIYRAKLKVSDDGNALTIHGYIGISLLGRSQTWLRDGSGSKR